MMLYLADARPLDVLDPWPVRVMFLLLAVLCAWLTFDTRRALKKLVHIADRWSPLGPRWSINPERTGWIWFYRIDAAVVLIGVVWKFVQYYSAR